MKNKISIGNAGEYFAAGELERHGYTVAVPMSNTEAYDILAINRENHRQYSIQVKTTVSNQKKWTLSEKNEKLVEDNFIYFFVSLNGFDIPKYHIVPSKIVAKFITDSHNKWRNTPGKKGQPHNDTKIRTFEDAEDKYLDNWECLK